MNKWLDLILSYTKESGECLIWTRCFNSDGYPRAVLGGDNNAKVHRVVFELVNGYLPEVVRHTCDNPKCLNPTHLVAGTALDNVRDRVARGRCHNKVAAIEFFKVSSMRLQGHTYREIATELNIKIKRVEYINNLIKKVRPSGG